MFNFSLWIIVGVAAGVLGRTIAPPPPKKPKYPQAPITILSMLGAIVSGMICDFAIRGNAAGGGPDYVSVVIAAIGGLFIVAIARVLEAYVEH